MTKQFLQFIKQQKLLLKGETTLLAVSGGVDSMVMVHLFAEAKLKFAIAHCNFGLRNEESTGDENLVKAMAEKLNVPFFCIHFETKKTAEEKHISIQMAARELRYTWLESIRKENNFAAIATAHHLNDSIETFLLNFTKGSGLEGLKGIRAKKEKTIRPLLFASKTEIELFAKENKLEFREDSSNASTKYQRNLIRHEVLPHLQKINPDVAHTAFENFAHLQDAFTIYNERIEQYRRKLLIQNKTETQILIGKLKAIKALPTVLWELLKPFDFNSSQVQQLCTDLFSTESRQFTSATHRLIKDRKFLSIIPLENKNPSEFLIENKNQLIETGMKQLNFSMLENDSHFKIPTDSSVTCVDADLLKFPLLMRHWRQGDYFYPLGMKMKKKKLSDYFMQQKLSATEKENCWLLFSEHKLVAVLNHRIDERFKISGATKTILKVS